MPNIVIIGTCDTKLNELLYLRSQIFELDSKSNVILVDAGRSSVQHEAITVTQDTLSSRYAPKEGSKNVSELQRGEVINYMISCASNWLQETYQHGINNAESALHGIVTAGELLHCHKHSSVQRTA